MIKLLGLIGIPNYTFNPKILFKVMSLETQQDPTPTTRFYFRVGGHSLAPSLSTTMTNLDSQPHTLRKIPLHLRSISGPFHLVAPFGINDEAP